MAERAVSVSHDEADSGKPGEPPKPTNESTPRKFINKFKESKFYAKPRVTSAAEPAVDGMIAIALDGGPQFLRDAVNKAKITLLSDTKKKGASRATQQSSRSGRSRPLVPHFVHWTVTLRFPLSLSVDPGKIMTALGT